MSEQQLIELCLAGEQTAIERLFNLHVEQAVRLAYLVTRDWSAAEDAVQEAFIRAFRSLKSLQSGRPFKPWFTKIVVNQARNRRRKTSRLAPLSAAEWVPDDNALPEEAAVSAERRAQVLQQIDRLDDNHRLPVLLKYFSDFSELEIAEALGLRISTVKSRLYTARQRLKAGLEAIEGGGRDERHC